jgi:hypothetical protein
MVFEDSSSTTSAGSRYLGEGFRHEPDFRDGAATYEVVTESGTATAIATSITCSMTRPTASPAVTACLST